MPPNRPPASQWTRTRADQFAFGVMLYEMVSGLAPVRSRDGHSDTGRHPRGRARPLGRARRRPPRWPASSIDACGRIRASATRQRSTSRATCDICSIRRRPIRGCAWNRPPRAPDSAARGRSPGGGRHCAGGIDMAGAAARAEVGRQVRGGATPRRAALHGPEPQRGGRCLCRRPRGGVDQPPRRARALRAPAQPRARQRSAAGGHHQRARRATCLWRHDGHQRIGAARRLGHAAHAQPD